MISLLDGAVSEEVLSIFTEDLAALNVGLPSGIAKAVTPKRQFHDTYELASRLENGIGAVAISIKGESMIQ